MELKNYINVRVQSHNNNKIIGVMKHNLRNIKSLNQENSNINFFYDLDNNKWLEMNNVNKKNEYNKLYKKFKQDREEHTNLNFKKSGRNIRDERQGTLFEGVFTFSEKIKEDLGNLYSLKDLQQVSLSSLEQIAAKYKTQIRGLYLHMDETTPHFHFLMRNFNDEDMSLYFKNKNKKFLSELQDLVFENFKILGMKRGVKKDITKKNYKTTKRHKEELQTQLKDLNKELELTQEEKKDIKRVIDNISQNLDKEDSYEKDLKNEITKELNKTKQEVEVFQGRLSSTVKRNYVTYSNDTLNNLYNFFSNREEQKLNDSLTLIKIQEDFKRIQKNKIEQLENDLKEKREKIYKLEIPNNEKEEKIKGLEETIDKKNRRIKKNEEEIKRLEKVENQNIELEEQNITIKNRLEEFEKIVKENDHLFPYFENLFEYEDIKPNRDINPKIRITM
ncbi:plasmid recombination protein [Aliarcobacter butzleri]|uniref:plasmid recombination protein n=1 Tax=Aliarcobacter butzleri TaxID=28197 RepID=UPI0021B4EE63|nr:plasmid recombination protein [Aliarcobacter butzleri]MCT7587726.1 plasmid recombination protein [Aliarcobacter butzleri]